MHHAYNGENKNSTFLKLVYIGIVAGIIGALVKSGVETLLPPRLLSATPPPIGLLELMGFDANNMTYTFMEQSVNWGGNGVHILFSIIIAVVFCFAVKFDKRFAVFGAIPFGLVMGLGAHCIVLPIIGIGPLPWHIPFQGYISEVVGTSFWIWTIDAVRQRMIA